MAVAEPARSLDTWSWLDSIPARSNFIARVLGRFDRQWLRTRCSAEFYNSHFRYWTGF